MLYSLLYIWVKLHALLPMRVLYVLADFLYIIIYRVLRYRLKVVRRNLAASFPEKSEQERRAIERGFYHHFADYIVETLKLAHISLEELQRRAYVQNPEVVDRLMDAGHPCCLLLMGHYGNWEWYSGSTTRFADAVMYQIYRPLNNKAVDKLFIWLRTKFGSRVISKYETGREVVRLQRNKVRSVVIFLADQTPSRQNLHYWTSFLNQDTELIDYQIEDELMLLNFNHSIFSQDKVLEEVSYSIAYSVFDNYDVNTVLLEVEGIEVGKIEKGK